MQHVESINFNNQEVVLRYDDEGRVNLNDIHRASGSLATKAPSKFLRNKKAKVLVDKASNSGGQICPALHIVMGNRSTGEEQGTYAHLDVMFGYAAWIDADFHAKVVQTFGAMAVGDIKRAKEIVRTAVRVEGIPVRKEVASKIMKYGDKTFIGDMTDAVNLYVTGKTAKGIRATRTEGFNKSTPTRDRMTDNELKAVTAIEALVALQIERDENKPDWMGRSSVRELVNNTGHTVRSMIQ